MDRIYQEAHHQILRRRSKHKGGTKPAKNQIKTRNKQRKAQRQARKQGRG